MDAWIEKGLRLHVFDDVIDSLVRILISRSLHDSETRRIDAERLLLVATHGAFTLSNDSDSVFWVDSAQERLALLRDLCRRGAISSRLFDRLRHSLVDDDDATVPELGTRPIGVTIGTMRWLIENKLVVLVSSSYQGLMVRNGEIEALKVQINDSTTESQVRDLAERAYRWLADRIAAKAVTTGPRRPPQIGTLQDLVPEAMPKSILLAASEFEVLLELDCISVQLDPFVRDLFSPSFSFLSLRAMGDHQSFLAARSRYETAAARMQSFVWFVSEVAPARKDELLEELLMWGDASAFSGKSLRRLVIDYPTLKGRAATALDKMERAALDNSHAGHARAALFLSSVYAEFFLISLDNDDKATIAAHWSAMLERWRRFVPVQKLWLLEFAVTAMVDRAVKGLATGDDDQTLVLSADTPLGAAVNEVLVWCANEPLDLLGNVVTGIALSLDKLTVHGPTMLQLAPLFLFLRGAPATGGLSLTHPRLEPLVVLSAFWESRPLAKINETIHLTHENGDSEEVVVALEDVLVDATIAAAEKREGTHFTTNSMRFRYALRKGLQIDAEVPTLAVLLHLGTEHRPAFARALGEHIGASDGVSYALLQHVIATPDDRSQLRLLARRALEGPMRQIRQVPALAAFLPELLQKVGQSTLELQVRALLSEASTSGDAVTRLEENLQVWSNRDDVFGLVDCTVMIPGALGWHWARDCVEQNREDNIKQARHFMAYPEAANFGELWWAIATSWLDAAQGTPEQRAGFQHTLERLLSVMIDTPLRGQREADCLATFREISQGFSSDPSTAVWITYRLFGWWFLQVRNSTQTIDDSLRDICLASIGRRQGSASADAADPRTWPAGFNVRLVSVLSAVSVVSQLANSWIEERSLPAWKLTLGDPTRRALAELAAGDIEPEGLVSPTLNWSPSLRVTMAALSSLCLAGGRFSDLSPSARERWLSWLPLDSTEDSTRLRAAVQQVLWLATSGLDELTSFEAAILVDRVSRSTAPSVTTSTLAAAAVAGAVARKLLPLEQAWACVKQHVGLDPAEKAVTLLFIEGVARAYREELAFYVTATLRVLGREVDTAQLRELVARETLFDRAEPLRDTILSLLA
jgi:hypothetical protein